MATAIATKLAEKKLEAEMENMSEQITPEGEGSRTRGKLTCIELLAAPKLTSNPASNWLECC